jgi:beta-glucosidase
MVEAHARMYDAIRANDIVDADGDGRPAEIGMVYSYAALEPRSGSEGDAKATEDARYFFHDMFMDGIVEGRLDERWDAGPGRAPVRADLANRCDFVGLNYYFKFRVEKWILPPLSFLSPFLSFNILAPFDADAPRGIYPVLMELEHRYHRPVYVTETGATQDDEVRGAAWLVDTLAEVSHAVRDGADVRGYFAWSLMDNYEWNHGSGMHFGLYAVDPASKARTPREAARVYGEIAKAREVPAALESHYASQFP